jgi:hypothetical protein
VLHEAFTGRSCLAFALSFARQSRSFGGNIASLTVSSLAAWPVVG